MLVYDDVTNSFMCRNTKDCNPGMFWSVHCYIALWDIGQVSEYGMVSRVMDFGNGVKYGIWSMAYGVCALLKVKAADFFQLLQFGMAWFQKKSRMG